MNIMLKKKLIILTFSLFLVITFAFPAFAKPPKEDDSVMTIQNLNITVAQKQYLSTHPELQAELRTLLENGIKTDEIKKIIEQRMKNPTAPTSQFTLGGFFFEYWQQILGTVISILSVILAVTGFSFASRKKQKSTSKYLHKIDETFHSLKAVSHRCEAELHAIKDFIDDDLKAGKMDESIYQLLIARIEKYLAEIQLLNSKEPKKP